MFGAAGLARFARRTPRKLTGNAIRMEESRPAATGSEPLRIAMLSRAPGSTPVSKRIVLPDSRAGDASRREERAPPGLTSSTLTAQSRQRPSTAPSRRVAAEFAGSGRAALVPSLSIRTRPSRSNRARSGPGAGAPDRRGMTAASRNAAESGRASALWITSAGRVA